MANPVLIELTASIVSAHVENNSVSVADLPSMISGVYGALGALGKADAEARIKPKPAVSVRRSVKPESLTCLDCGSNLRALKRHIGNTHGLSPEAYRKKWGLPAEYPMSASASSERRSKMAKARWFGTTPGRKAKLSGGS